MRVVDKTEICSRTKRIMSELRELEDDLMRTTSEGPFQISNAQEIIEDAKIKLYKLLRCVNGF